MLYSDYADDDLPLPSFREVFAFALRSPATVNQKDNGRKRAFSKSSGNYLDGELDPKNMKPKRQKESNSDETTGRWSAEEHKLFLQGIMLYGKDWKKMQPLIKTRSLVQIRTHAQKVFKKIGLKKLDGNDSVKEIQEYLQSRNYDNRAMSMDLNNDKTFDSKKDSTAKPVEAPSSSTVSGLLSNTLQTSTQMDSTTSKPGTGLFPSSSSSSLQRTIGGQFTNYSIFHPNSTLPLENEERPSTGSDGTTSTFNRNQIQAGFPRTASNNSFYQSSSLPPSSRLAAPSVESSNSGKETQSMSYLNDLGYSYRQTSQASTNKPEQIAPPSPGVNEYLSMLHESPVSEEDLRLLRQHLNDMKDNLLNDEEEDDEPEEDLEGEQKSRYRSLSSYDAMDKQDNYQQFHNLQQHLSNQSAMFERNHLGYANTNNSTSLKNGHVKGSEFYSNRSEAESSKMTIGSRGLSIGGQPLPPAYPPSSQQSNWSSTGNYLPTNGNDISNYSYLTQRNYSQNAEYYNNGATLTQSLPAYQSEDVNVARTSLVNEHSNQDSFDHSNYLNHPDPQHVELLQSLHQLFQGGTIPGTPNSLHGQNPGNGATAFDKHYPTQDLPAAKLPLSNDISDSESRDEEVDDDYDGEEDGRGDDSDPIIALANRYLPTHEEKLEK